MHKPYFCLTLQCHQPVAGQAKKLAQSGDLEARLRQLENENEKLTLSNIRLLRANRILKLDSDRIVDEQTTDLKEEISQLKLQNVRLQRSNRLLRDDLDTHRVDTYVEPCCAYLHMQLTR